MPDVPQPVPISTTDRAPMAAARNRNVLPVSGLTGAAPPISAAFRRAATSASSSGWKSSM
jgi:hypothetical protein